MDKKADAASIRQLIVALPQYREQLSEWGGGGWAAGLDAGAGARGFKLWVKPRMGVVDTSPN